MIFSSCWPFQPCATRYKHLGSRVGCGASTTRNRVSSFAPVSCFQWTGNVWHKGFSQPWGQDEARWKAVLPRFCPQSSKNITNKVNLTEKSFLGTNLNQHGFALENLPNLISNLISHQKTTAVRWHLKHPKSSSFNGWSNKFCLDNSQIY